MSKHAKRLNISISTHTLTWSVTQNMGRFWFYIEYFNSHAHVERDPCCNPYSPLIYISTHTLTWSVTSKIFPHNSQTKFQLTRSRGAWRGGAKEHTLFEKFQLTRSRGAWLYCYLHMYTPLIFQLTRSRGAWLLNRVINMFTWNFNSHAHVERDFYNDKTTLKGVISTHTLTWSVTRGSDG